MPYPLISEYIETIKSAEDNFEELSYLRPVLGDDGLPVMTSGNFAVVFKMKDVQSGKFYAVKCFTKEQEGRAEAYREITKELKDVSSPYLTSVRYLDKELFVDTDQTTETEFPVLLMDWVEGKTLDKYLRENLDDKYALEMLAYRFSQLAQWLIPQPFAHGDLKPDNIIVRENGTIALVDYDGMYVPEMILMNILMIFLSCPFYYRCLLPLKTSYIGISMQLTIDYYFHLMIIETLINVP